jgi:hypothetical protein
MIPCQEQFECIGVDADNGFVVAWPHLASQPIQETAGLLAVGHDEY